MIGLWFSDRENKMVQLPEEKGLLMKQAEVGWHQGLGDQNIQEDGDRFRKGGGNTLEFMEDKTDKA